MKAEEKLAEIYAAYDEVVSAYDRENRAIRTRDLLILICDQKDLYGDPLWIPPAHGLVSEQG